MIRKTKSTKRILSLALTLLMVLEIMPMNVLAKNMQAVEEDLSENTYESEYVTDNDKDTDTEENIFDKIVCEITDKRDLTTKHFLRSDGTYAAVSYSSPIHYQKEIGGKWIEIDNTLVEKEDKNGNKYLTPHSSPIDVELSEKADSNNLIRYNINGNDISWSYEDGNFGLLKKNSTASKIKNNIKTAKINNNSKFLDNLESKVKYNHFYNDVDIEYTVTAEGLKENIILNSNKAQNNFSIKYNIGELSAEQTDERTITLYNGNVAVAEIAAPYMFDNDMATSTKLSIKIQSQKDGVLKVKLLADKNWLKDKNRVYPVTIDPYVSKANVDINNDATALEKGSSSSYPHGSLMVGRNYTYGKCRSFLKFNLPNLSAGDMVVGGQVSLCQFPGENGYSTAVGSTSSQINIGRVSTSWTDDSIIKSSSFSGIPSVPYSEKLDYINTSSASGGAWVTFDVGRTVKDWYNGKYTNYGFVLWAEREDEYTCTTFASANYDAESTSYKPTLTVIYLNNKGLEDRWTYHSQSLESSGTSYINDCTGNLVFVAPIYSGTGNNSPANISLVYNGYLCKDDGLGQGRAGKGWRFDFQQKIVKIVKGSSELNTALYSAGFRYIYTDADGTDHYFIPKSGSTTQFVDEEGLNYILTVNESSADAKFTLEFKSGAKNIYKSDGTIRKICDADNNYYQYIYDSNNRITSIKDGASRIITLSYSGNNVSSIKDPAGRVTYFVYNTTYNLLTSITYSDGTTTKINYNDYRVAKITAVNGTALSYTYPSSSHASVKNRVVSVTELGTDGTTGASLTMDYSYNNSTKFKDNKNRSETYIFDNYGRTICVNDANGGGENYTYNKESSTDLGNKMTAAMQKTAFVNNLLKNHSFESSMSSWSLDGSGGTCTAATDSPYLGTKSLKIAKTSTTNLKAYQRINVDGVNLKVGNTYTFSAYIKTISASPNSSIYANCFDNSSGSNVSLAVYSSPTINEQVSEYKRIYFYFTIPSGTDFVNFVLSSKGSGTTYYDCIQVEEGKVVNEYNLLEDSAFTNSSSVWVKSSKVGTVEGVTGGSCKITGSQTDKKAVYQSVKINKPASKCAFSLSAIAKANSVPIDNAKTRYFALNGVLIYTDGTEEYFNFMYNTGITDWQYVTGIVKASSKNSGKTISEIRTRLIYYFNANTAYYDNVSLNIDETGTSYTYDSKGNLISASDNANTNQKFTYSSAKNLLTANYEDNTSYSYTYNESGTNKHRLLTAKSNNSNILITYGYNAKGSVSSVTVSSSGTSQKIVTSSTYGGTNSNELRSETDSLGNTTSYTYNTSQGTLATVTDSAGNITSYGYNANNDLLTSVTSGGSTVSYNYNSSNRTLSSIKTPTVTYNFTYDNFMNPSTVAVGSQTLSTNTYESNNGNLTKSTYGNGNSVSYIYDNLDRVTTKAYNDSKGNEVERFNWAYDAAGRTSRYYEAVGNKVYNYTYDLSGRIIEMYRNDGSYIRTNYDERNLTTGVDYSFAGAKASVSYSYNKNMDNALEQTMFTNGDFVKKSYDSLGRNTRDYIYANNVIALKTDYKYLNNSSDSTKTSGLVSEITYNNDNINNLRYEYDNRGNIKYVITDNILYDKYTYDALNQLTRADCESTDKTYIYTYDKSGNITSKKTYTCNYVDEDLSVKTLLETINYTYGDSNWKDKLTAYNGKTITYDKIGNPLTYNGQSFTWLGRRMMTYSDGKTTTSYNYNSDGIRTTKTIGGTATTYLLDGSTILAQNTGNTTIPFYYDASGKRIAFKYNGEMYYYVYNLQGDVTQIMKADKSIAGTYKYDAWGRIINLGSLTAVAKANPFRYRGYYYDTESNLYYLNSRYYNPEWGRFINADGQLLITNDAIGMNLFAYCYNNPVINIDPLGNCPYNGTAADFHRLEQGLPSLDCTCNNSSLSVAMSKKATNRRDSGLQGIPDDEIQRRARDKSLSGPERNRYKEEEKVRGLRNKQKRQNYSKLELTGEELVGIGIMAVSGVCIIAIFADNVTFIGVADDVLVLPLVEFFEKGAELVI